MPVTPTLGRENITFAARSGDPRTRAVPDLRAPTPGVLYVFVWFCSMLPIEKLVAEPSPMMLRPKGAPFSSRKLMNVFGIRSVLVEVRTRDEEFPAPSAI